MLCDMLESRLSRGPARTLKKGTYLDLPTLSLGKYELARTRSIISVFAKAHPILNVL